MAACGEAKGAAVTAGTGAKPSVGSAVGVCEKPSLGVGVCGTAVISLLAGGVEDGAASLTGVGAVTGAWLEGATAVGAVSLAG